MSNITTASKLLRQLLTISATVILATGTVSAVNAAPILETVDNLGAGLTTAANNNLTDGPGNKDHLTQFGDNGGLIFGNVDATKIDEIAGTNAEFFGVEVDALVKTNPDGTVANLSEDVYRDGLTFSSSPFIITNIQNDGRQFDWAFDESVITAGLTDGWQIVKIGLKYGAGGQGGVTQDVYFWIDGDNDGIAEANDGAISGSFDITLYYDEGVDSFGGLSHINWFGTPGDENVPEPGVLALLGFGLVGLGLARRRRS